MARQSKTLPARRQDAADDSLLIRSAESLGRMIGSLQRQLDAARQLTVRSAGATARTNGHAPGRQQHARDDAPKKSTASKRTAKAATATKKTTTRKRAGSKRRTTKTGRGT